MQIQLLDFAPDGAYEFRWPTGNIERYPRSWLGHVGIDGRVYEFRHGLGHRHVYGRSRVRGVTWLTGAPMVEGVEADDYPQSPSLLSILRRPDKRHARSDDDVPPSYEGFLIVDCRSEISAPYSPRALAVKIIEDNVAQWTTHAAIRAITLGRLRHQPRRERPIVPEVAPSGPPADPRRVVSALLDFKKHARPVLAEPRFEPTADPRANALLSQNPSAFLFAVIADQGIPAERAWAAPYELRRRLGHLDLNRIVAEPDGVEAAMKGPPALHRHPAKVAGWVVAAARRILERYGGDASRIWADDPSARKVYERLVAFDGIGQKKAAMAVEILERNLGVPIKEMHGSDVAYDIHVRRVFLRTGLAQRDDVDHIVSVARELRPERPGELDLPAWLIGRQWCHAGTPDCGSCPLTSACPKIIYQTARTVSY